MVGTEGFEPSTPTTPLWCATRLRYAPILFSFKGLELRPTLREDANNTGFEVIIKRFLAWINNP